MAGLWATVGWGVGGGLRLTVQGTSLGLARLVTTPRYFLSLSLFRLRQSVVAQTSSYLQSPHFHLLPVPNHFVNGFRQHREKEMDWVRTFNR